MGPNKGEFFRAEDIEKSKEEESRKYETKFRRNTNKQPKKKKRKR